MSYVSSVVIVGDYLATDDRDYIGSYQHRGHPIHFVEPKACDTWGGEKCAEADLLLGAFNYLDVEAFIAHMHARKFMMPLSLTVETNGEHFHVSVQSAEGEWSTALDQAGY